MQTQDTITRRQFVAVAFVAVLSPLIRRFPRTLAAAAGRTAWLSVPLAAAPLLAGVLLAALLFRGQTGRSFSDILTAVLGRFCGRALTLLYTLWLLFYSGFLLLSGANRFISTVYPGAGPGVFIVATVLPCALAAAGQLKSIARSAMLFRPLMTAVLVFIFIMSVKNIDPGMLLPLTAADILPNCRAALELANVISVAAFLAFLGDRVEGRFTPRDWAGWGAALLGIIGLMVVDCLGLFGPELTGRMTFPFFMLARDVAALGSVERIEPVVIVIWVLSDFILISVLLWLAARNLQSCFSPSSPEKKRGRTAALCAAAAAASAFVCAGDIPTFNLLSETVVPLVNAALIAAVPLLVLLIGKLRRKL